MTLSTTRINQYGRKLFDKMLQGEKLSPDACADAYEMFVRRMRRYRDRHPGTGKVSPRFVNKCERWITANLLTQKKRRRIKAALKLETAKRELNTFEKPKARVYARLFLLSHAFNLSPRRVSLFWPKSPASQSHRCAKPATSARLK